MRSILRDLTNLNLDFTPTNCKQLSSNKVTLYTHQSRSQSPRSLYLDKGSGNEILHASGSFSTRKCSAFHPRKSLGKSWTAVSSLLRLRLESQCRDNEEMNLQSGFKPQPHTTLAGAKATSRCGLIFFHLCKKRKQTKSVFK